MTDETPETHPPTTDRSPMEPGREPLSAAGHRRRATMRADLLDELERVAGRRRGRRRIVRAGGSVAVLGLVLTAAVHLAPTGSDTSAPRTADVEPAPGPESGSLAVAPAEATTPGPTTGRPVARRRAADGPAGSDPVSIRLVRTEAGIAERHRTGAGPSARVEVIEDPATLVATLASMDHRTGLIRRGGRLELTNPVPNTSRPPEGGPPAGTPDARAIPDRSPAAGHLAARLVALLGWSTGS